jgi:integrase
MTQASLSGLLQRFFTERLVGQLNASPHTVAAYRDTFRILLRFASGRIERAPCDLLVEDLDAAFVSRFLASLETQRRNSESTRNCRLAAVHAFFRYVAVEEPARALQCQQVLAIPRKRHERGPVEFLAPEEADALLAAPDPRTWIGRRDRTILLVALQTGLRNSEIRGLALRDVNLGKGAHVRCLGKGRKARNTPLRPDVAAALKAWLAERRCRPEEPVFPSTRGGPMSADALQRMLTRHCVPAAKVCPSLARKPVSPHTLRHTAAMDLLQRGVDLTVIALWLGHESTETTQMYIHADMQLKERALAHATAAGRPPPRFTAPDRLLAFLEGL